MPGPDVVCLMCCDAVLIDDFALLIQDTMEDGCTEFDGGGTLDDALWFWAARNLRESSIDNFGFGDNTRFERLQCGVDEFVDEMKVVFKIGVAAFVPTASNLIEAQDVQSMNGNDMVDVVIDGQEQYTAIG